jgi:pimeloyl-ACP methyl ester carboxylesterase
MLIAFIIIASLIFDHFVQFRKTDEHLQKFFTEHKVPATIKYRQDKERMIRYVVIGADTLPTLFMLHGAPSSLSIYEGYFTDTFFLKHFRMVAVDRPGYGGSGFGDPEPSIEKQSQILWPILDSVSRNNKPLMIVAGSYGTSVACRMVMDRPGIVDGMMLIAPSLAPGEEKVYWFTYIIDFPLVKWFIPRMFQSANTEKIHHQEELEKMIPMWNRVNIPVFYLQGANDRLIYTSNAEFAKTRMNNVPYLNIEFLKDRPHFFAFSDRMIIRQKIIDLYTYLLKQQRQ